MITQVQVDHTNLWLRRFRKTYHDGIPMQLHSRDIAADGSREWGNDFRRFMTGADRRLSYNEEREEDPKIRLKRAMKRIRTRSLREYEVLYRVMVQGESISAVTAWLNERAAAGGHDDRYTTSQTAVIVYAAVDKLYAWY